MSEEITVYEKPTCTTCRKLAALFTENGIDFKRVNYFIEPLTEAKLKTLLKKTGLKPYEVVRQAEPTAKELGLTVETSDADVIRAIVENPSILQRPIVEVGDRAVLARPVEKALELIGKVKQGNTK